MIEALLAIITRRFVWLFVGLALGFILGGRL
jgi:hypothetical protein